MNRVRLNERNFCLEVSDCNSTRRTLCGWISLLYENQEDERAIWVLTEKIVATKIGGIEEYDCIDEAILDVGMSESEVSDIYHLIMDAMYGVTTASKDRTRNKHPLQDNSGGRSDPDVQQGHAAV